MSRQGNYFDDAVAESLFSNQKRRHGHRNLVGSVHGTNANEDSSFDLYFGPKLPADVPEDNWLETVPGKRWFAYLHLCELEDPYFEKIWVPGDLELVN